MRELKPHWEIRLTRQAEKTLYRLSKNLLQRLDQAILALAENPHPPACEQLPGHDHLYRLHVAEWRIAYAVQVERSVVLIVEITPKQQPERYRLEEEADESISPEGPQSPEQAVTPMMEDLPHRQFSSEFWPTQGYSLLKRLRREKIRLLIVEYLTETHENLHKLLYFEPDIVIVDVAATGEAAIQMAVKQQPDIVLMDTNLPGIDGFAACEQISQQVPSTQVIMMSAWGTDDYTRRAMLAGAKEFLIKPFSRDELMTTIRRVYQSAAFQKLHDTQVASYRRDAFQDLKERLQAKLMAELAPTMDISRPDEVRQTIQEMFERMLAQENIILSRSERERLFEDIVAEILGSMNQSSEASPGESQINTTALWFKFYKLGHNVEISLSVADLSESLTFYEKLGFAKVDGGEKPYPWAVVSDGQLHLGLHQQVFSSPTLSYFGLGILSERMTHLPKLGVRLDNIQKLEPVQGMQNSELLYGMKFITAEFESPERQRVLLADVSSDVETTPTGRKFFSKYEASNELSLNTKDINATLAYWEKLGFECIATGVRPYPWAIISDGLIRLSLHQTPKLTKPTLTYFAPNMPERLKRLRRKGLKFKAEHKDKEGRRVGAVIESPDGQPFFLCTGANPSN